MANSTSPVPQVVEGTGAVQKINDLFDAGSQAVLGGRNAATSALLVFGYIGGRINGINTANGTVTLTASTTNYIVWKKSDGVVSVSTATTNWDNSTDYWRLYSVVTSGSTWTSYVDERSSSFGLFGIGAPAGLSNPMNAVGDIVVGASSGTPARLGIGTNTTDVLGVSSGTPAWVKRTPVAVIIACGDETTAITTGTAKVTFRMPFAMTLLAGNAGVRASVTTAPTGSGNLTVDVNEGGTTILSTKLTFDASEKTTTTAAAPPVISDTSLADDAEITIDVDAVSGTVTGAGLKVSLIGYPA